MPFVIPVDHPDPALAARLYSPLPLVLGEEVVLDAGRSHYLAHVLRLKEGAWLAVFHPESGEFAARIVALGKREGRVRLEACRRPPPEGDSAKQENVWLLPALIKRTRLELVVEKAVELGVDRIAPLITRHTDQPRLNPERLQLLAIEAAEQCERLTVPEIMAAQPLATVLAQWPPERHLVVCAEGGAVTPLAVVARQCPPGPVGLMIGPEGGFSAHEQALLAARPGVQLAGLGPRILRAETAALAALAVWQAVRGDWQDAATGQEHRPPFRKPAFQAGNPAGEAAAPRSSE